MKLASVNTRLDFSVDNLSKDVSFKALDNLIAFFHTTLCFFSFLFSFQKTFSSLFLLWTCYTFPELGFVGFWWLCRFFNQIILWQTQYSLLIPQHKPFMGIISLSQTQQFTATFPMAM